VAERSRFPAKVSATPPILPPLADDTDPESDAGQAETNLKRRVDDP